MLDYVSDDFGVGVGRDSCETEQMSKLEEPFDVLPLFRAAVQDHLEGFDFLDDRADIIDRFSAMNDRGEPQLTGEGELFQKDPPLYILR